MTGDKGFEVCPADLGYCLGLVIPEYAPFFSLPLWNDNIYFVELIEVRGLFTAFALHVVTLKRLP